MTDQELREFVERLVSAIEDAGSQNAQWWEILAALGPVLLFLSALVAAYVAWKSLKQQKLNEARSEWWRRAQWALGASVSTDSRMMTYGIEILDELASSELTTEEDERLLDAVWSGTDTEMSDDAVHRLFDSLSSRDDLTEDEKAGVTSYETIPVPEDDEASVRRENLFRRVFGPRESSMDDPRSERDTE